QGAAALARAGARRVAAALGKFAELGRVAALEAEASAGIERAGWLTLGAALAADPDDPALLAAAVSGALAAGQWSKAREALDRQADLSRDRDWAATLL